MVSICSLIANSSSPICKPLRTISSATITIGMTVTVLFHNFLRYLTRPKHLSLLSLSLIFSEQSTGTAKPMIQNILFLLLIITLLLIIIVFRPKLRDLCVSQSPREFVLYILLDGLWFVHIPFGSMLTFLFLAQFPVDHLPHSVVPCFIPLFEIVCNIHLLHD